MRHFSGEFSGMQLLMLDELDAIAGGDGEDTDDTGNQPIEEIVVYGHATGGGNIYYVPLPYWFSGTGAGTATMKAPEGSDGASVHVDVHISRPLTATEQQAVNDLNSAIQSITSTINNIPNNAHISVNGQNVTGAELKAMWSMADFNINDVGTSYANGTTRGEANWNNGNPEISFNIDTLTSYDALTGGMNYVVLHEIGHMTGAGRGYNTSMYADGVVTAAENAMNEQIANDTARAIASSAGLAVLTNPTYGYSTPSAASFAQ